MHLESLTVLEIYLVSQVRAHLLCLFLRNVVTWKWFNEEVKVRWGFYLRVYLLTLWISLDSLLEFLKLADFKSYLRKKIKEVCAHLKVNVSGYSGLIYMHHSSDLPHDKRPFLFEELRLVNYLEYKVLLYHFVRLKLPLFFDEVSLSILGGTEQGYWLILHVKLAKHLYLLWVFLKTLPSGNIFLWLWRNVKLSTLVVLKALENEQFL